MARGDIFVVQPFRRRGRNLAASEPYACGTEREVFRRGLAMQGRVEGMVFYRIDTSASGDQWTEIEVLAVDGLIPGEAA